MKDGISGLGLVASLVPAMVTATTKGSHADLQGFGSATLIVNIGAIAGDGLYVIAMQESDTTTDGDFTDVNATDLLGSLPAELEVSTVYKQGYNGTKRYIGAYAYAIAVINMGDSTIPLILSIVVPALFAALLGYFLFYARITDVYFGVITLTVTLILYKLMGTTSGSAHTIGHAAIGGYNGIPAIPPLNLPGSPTTFLSLDGLFYAAGLTLLAVYVGLRLMLKSRFGQVVVAIRENERRAELLGYDARFYKLAAFTIGGGIAGLSGCLFANWGMFISPDVFGLAQSAQVIIWVIVGGTGTLLGPIVGCFLVQWIATQLGTQQVLNANLVLGTILIGFVLLVPKGITPTVLDLIERTCQRRSYAKPLVEKRNVS